jgi:hypothetical protein
LALPSATQSYYAVVPPLYDNSDGGRRVEDDHSAGGAPSAAASRRRSAISSSLRLASPAARRNRSQTASRAARRRGVAHGQGIDPQGAARAHDHRLPTSLPIDGAYAQSAPRTAARPADAQPIAPTDDHDHRPIHLVHQRRRKFVVTGSGTSPDLVRLYSRMTSKTLSVRVEFVGEGGSAGVREPRRPSPSATTAR